MQPPFFVSVSYEGPLKNQSRRSNLWNLFAKFMIKQPFRAFVNDISFLPQARLVLSNRLSCNSRALHSFMLTKTDLSTVPTTELARAIADTGSMFCGSELSSGLCEKKKGWRGWSRGGWVFHESTLHLQAMIFVPHDLIPPL